MVSCCVNAAAFDASQVKPSGLSPAQAKLVLTVVLHHLHYKMVNKDMFIDGPWEGEKKGTFFRPGYYDFGLVYNNPTGAASNVLGHFAVNIMNGDVWQTESCERYGFPALSRIQRDISKRTGKSLADKKSAQDEIGC